MNSLIDGNEFIGIENMVAVVVGQAAFSIETMETLALAAVVVLCRPAGQLLVNSHRCLSLTLS